MNKTQPTNDNRLSRRLRTLELVLAKRGDQLDTYGQHLDALFERIEHIERALNLKENS